ncbi:MAG: WYL domain-containing protein [Alphaproteobacteria bacterium]|nr:WYL domain-containing protein [Alphaproteobacteria bacterium]
MARRNHRKAKILMELINALRTRDMTFQDIRDLLSDLYIQNDSIDKRSQVGTLNDSKISEKTVQRTLDAVRDIYDTRLDFNPETKSYRLYIDDFPDTLSPEELQALDVAIQKAGANTPIRHLLETLKEKLTTKLYRSIKNLDPKRGARQVANIQQKIDADFAFIGPHAKITINPDIKAQLDDAILNQHKVIIQYKGRQHTVCPLGVMYGPNNVYMVAKICWKDTIGDMPLNYILPEISAITDTGEWFARDNAFTIETYANSMFGVFHEPNTYDIEWRVAPHAATEALRYQFHPTQKITKNPDGSLTIRFQAGGLYAISLYLTQWGGAITPTAPAELITMYRTLLRDCMNSISTK